jgi:outer membrane protein assembly factor BamD (BamD/ComL family)
MRTAVAAAAALAALAGSMSARGGPSTNIAFVLLAGVRNAQEQQYREREVLDTDRDEWVAQPATAPATPEGELEQARALLAQGQPGQAEKLLRKWIKANPEHERHYEGVFLLGEALFERQRFYQAYEQYELVVENTGGELFHSALERERDVALAFLSGKKRVVWKMLRLPAYDEAIDVLGRIWERVPGTRLAEDALRTKADYYFNRGDMDLAQDEYANLAREYPAGRFVQLAMLRSAEAAEAAFPGIRFDDHPLLEADTRYRQVQGSFPAFAERQNVPQRLDGIRQLRAEKDLDIAKWYQRTRQPAAAEFYYRLVLKDWPDTLAAAEAHQRLRGLGIEVQTEGPPP